MSATIPLSVIVITRNEEDRLADCLESVRWAREIIVVDDHSTDRTVEIARRFTDRIVQRKMEIEGVHRNFAYELATQEWILSLDADERVTPELRDEIASLLATAPSLNGYTIPRRNYLGTRWLRYGGFYPSAQLRLFRKGHFHYEEAEVHPRAFLDTLTGHLTHDLIHYSYRDLHDFVAKLNRQTTLETRKWLRDGRPMSARKGLWRALDRFWRTYRGKEGYRDGTLGFILAVLAGMYQFLSFAKFWAAAPTGGVAPPPLAAATTKQAEAASRLRLASKPLAPGPRQTISAVILTKNEAGRIRSCLQALRWVDEMIVVDGESTDGTPDICREHGAKVVTHRFSGDFGQERNVGTEHATKDWTLQLDADDLVTDEFCRAADAILRRGSPHAAYRFRRTNCFLGRWMRHGGWDHYSLHFFRRGKARYQGRVHHDLLVDGTIGVLNAPVEHYPFDSLEQFLDRQNRYSSLEAQELFDREGPVPEATLRYHIMRRPLKLFWKVYVKKRAFLDGMHGLIFTGLFSFVYFLKWAKYWERCDGAGRR